ncbi:GDSL-type esterase/lipase family protein [Agaribacterium sp. ZY112]|uniref:GDSL-type esterase/lipase family protein n=1 Tax=Agaribacterium sp. ZY112 TaxID=3233574 RepID=UPI003523F792
MHDLLVVMRLVCLALSFSIFTALSSTSVYADNTIQSDHQGFQYTGRIDFSKPKKPILSWPGSSVKALFSGDKLSITLDDSSGNNYFNVIVDGNSAYPYVIATKKGQHSYVIDGLAEGEHSLEIYKRTEGHEGASKFLGIAIADKGRMLKAPSALKRKIAFFGDSITSGMGNEAADNSEDNKPEDKNNYLSYSSITARKLNAEHHTVSLSGIGVMVSWFDFSMPDYFDQLSAVGNNNSQWDFSRWTPDIVVVNLLQNDSWLVGDTKRLSPTPSEQEIVQSYADFIQSIRAKYKGKPLICVLGSMDVTQANSPWPSYVEKAIKLIKQKDGSADIDMLEFDFTGYKAHPRVHQHQRNADILTDFIARKMQW